MGVVRVMGGHLGTISLTSSWRRMKMGLHSIYYDKELRS